MNVRLFLSCLVAGLSVGLATAQEGKTTLRFSKVAFLGNSITKHGPKPSIDWHGNWGMAATAEAKDYVHLVTAGLTKAQGAAPQVLINNIAQFEREHATFDIEKGLAATAAFGASHIVLAIGENVPALTTDAAKSTFKAKMQALLKLLSGPQKPTIIVRSSFWANPAKDQILEEVCREVGGVFVDLRAVSKDESNYARSERPYKHAGVANHPGDKGMQSIADAILKALSQP
ncbi:MAG: SGNH/GDSL hydrolase family protein [Prosthecobacter sp.]